MRIENISLPPLPGTSYQTAPLLGDGVALRERAADFFVQSPNGQVQPDRESITAASVAAGRCCVRLDPGSVPCRRPLVLHPKHGERFAYFRLAADLNLDQMADFIGICAGTQ